MAADPNSMVQEAVDVAIRDRGEIGLQVAAYVDGQPVVDVWVASPMKPPGSRSMPTRSFRCSPSPRL